MKKLFVAGLIVLFWGQSYALRCGNNLVLEGDTLVQVVEKCGQADSVYSNWPMGENVTLTYKQGSVTYTLSFLRNSLTSIDMNRN